MAGPSKIKIGNHTYSVKYVVPDDGSGDYFYGRTHTRTTRMEINPTQAKSQARDTLLHEVLHAILDDVDSPLDDEKEESVIRAITPGLLGVLRNNPALLTFLLSKETDG